jgi:hypothetical protein
MVIKLIISPIFCSQIEIVYRDWACLLIKILSSLSKAASWALTIGIITVIEIET